MMEERKFTEVQEQTITDTVIDYYNLLSTQYKLAAEKHLNQKEFIEELKDAKDVIEEELK